MKDKSEMESDMPVMTRVGDHCGMSDRTMIGRQGPAETGVAGA